MEARTSAPSAAITSTLTAASSSRISPNGGAGRGPGHTGHWGTLRQRLGMGGGTGLVVLVGEGGVKPPSFHAPLALMCTHARGLLKAIQTASWWDHSRFPSHVLTPQTLCPLPSSKTNNVCNISFFFCSPPLVNVRPCLSETQVSAGPSGETSARIHLKV